MNKNQYVYEIIKHVEKNIFKIDPVLQMILETIPFRY